MFLNKSKKKSLISQKIKKKKIKLNVLELQV